MEPVFVNLVVAVVAACLAGVVAGVQFAALFGADAMQADPVRIDTEADQLDRLKEDL